MFFNQAFSCFQQIPPLSVFRPPLVRCKHSPFYPLLASAFLLAESFWSLTPDCLLVLSAEFLVDWIKHAFITRFNEVSAEVYKDYTTSLAYDLAQTKQKHVSQ